MEWIERGEWIQGIRDPNAMAHPIAPVIQSMAGRYERCGCIGVEGYWKEPPKALRAVQYYESALGACKRRLAERMNRDVQ